MTTKTKPKIDAVTLNLINKLKKIEDTINEGAWEYIHLGDIIRLQDASQEAISHFDLRKEGGVVLKFQEKWVDGSEESVAAKEIITKAYAEHVADSA